MSVEEAPAVTGDAGNGVVAERSGQIESGDPVGAAEAADVVTEVWQPDSVDAGATEDPDVTPPAEELVDADAEASAAPEGGAALGALHALIADGLVKPDDTVVLFNTGGALKYLDVLDPA